jgi:SMI1 / KNR4 family (SUKH-1)
MDWSALGWEGCRHKASDIEIGEVEAELSIKFPDDYKECVRVCAGGYPKNSNFTFTDQRYGVMQGCLGAMLSFDKDDPENFLETYRELSEQLPEGLVPFADDGGGDFICFDYRTTEKPNAPSVVYWHHERNAADSLTHLCDSFTAFIKMLRE